MYENGCICIGDMLRCPKTNVLEDVHKNRFPLTNIMSEHRVLMIYFNLLEIGKYYTYGGSKSDGVFLGVLPCSDWMLGPYLFTPLHLHLL